MIEKTIEVAIRLYVEFVDGVPRIRPAHPTRPEIDVFIRLEVERQHGPCENHVLAESDRCMGLQFASECGGYRVWYPRSDTGRR
ncbi:MAG: hypothetical protein HC923_13385 [Myxococcales bacterium]|nr:hypothetical protein [Myxococcales bacterium]